MTVAYDEILADRVRDVLAGETGLSERKMFGGLAFMLDGHMCCGLVGDRLMLRLGADEAANALRLPYVAPMGFTGRPMSGRRGDGHSRVEGSGSFGAGLTHFLAEQASGWVFEVSRLRRERRPGGKTDALDAVRAARSVLTVKRPRDPTRQRRTRGAASARGRT